jgi:flagellar hook-associated protein 3 FlgL
MMHRVSTAGNYQSALLNLMAAQQRGVDAQNRLATEKVATDLKGFGRGAETLTALKSAQTKVQGFLETGQAVEARLATQALAFDRIAEGADGARLAITEALATGSLTGLMQALANQFQTAMNGLNTQHQGRYLFSGGAVDVMPTPHVSLSQLAAMADVSEAFQNDNLVARSRINEGAEMATGFLADAVGGPLFEIFRAIQQFHDDGSPDGRLTGPVTDDVRTFLEGQIGALKTVHGGIIDQAARNGGLQNRVESVLKSHEDQSLALTELIGKRTDADMAQAVTDLEMAQISIQASAQVISQLRSTSLLDLLRF